MIHSSVRLGGLKPRRTSSGKPVAHYRPEDGTLAVAFNDVGRSLVQPGVADVSGILRAADGTGGHDVCWSAQVELCPPENEGQQQPPPP